MIHGIQKFREYFSGHEHRYAIIGGAACDLLFADEGLEFRATKDLDIVLCVEVVEPEFAKAFKGFLEAGGYQARERSDGQREYYRFHKPVDQAFPYMIELFSRHPAGLEFPEDVVLAPVTVEENIISLSAILLDENYYEVLRAARRTVDGVTVVDERILIPLKARAYVDLMQRSQAGEQVDSRHIRKHRSDVFRLAQLLTREVSFELPETVLSDLRSFLDAVQDDESLDPKSFGVPLTRHEALELLRSAYGLPDNS